MQVTFHSWNVTIQNFLQFLFALLMDSNLLLATKVKKRMINQDLEKICLDIYYTVQSTSKPFTYAAGLDLYGADYVNKVAEIHLQYLRYFISVYRTRTFRK